MEFTMLNTITRLTRILSIIGCVSVLALSLALGQALAPATATGNDDDSFRPIFDGKSLNGWAGSPTYWRVENGNLVGEVTPETLLKQNSFIIWQGGTPSDFELKATYRVSSQGNSGINYRSNEVAGVPWALRGPQADIDGEVPSGKKKVRHTGQNYEERGRTFLALRGQIVRAEDGKKPLVLGSLGSPEELLAVIKNGDWNEYHLIARGGILIHMLNGRVVSIVIDDASDQPRSGMIGVQVHVGPPMKIEYRDIRLRTL